MGAALSRRSYARLCSANSWEELWEAGPYYERVSELLEDSKRYAIVVGWQIDSRLPLKRPARPPSFPEPAVETLKQKLIRLCDTKPDLHIYILMWAHAYFYVFERETWQARIWEDIHPRIHFVFDNRHPLGGSHHEKITLIDGRVALCGGIDLCDERWDTPGHLFQDPRRSLQRKKEHHGPYHDLAVQVTGSICAELHRHVAWRWRRISTIPFPKPLRMSSPPAARPVYFSRTLAAIDTRSRGTAPLTREIEFLYRDLIQNARRRIILEGQYYWSEEVNDLLIAKMHERRGHDFEIVLILADLRNTRSLTRHMSHYELQLLEKLQAAAVFTGTRLKLGCPYSYPSPSEALARSPSPSGPLHKSIYVHSKVLIIDDRFLSIGSANFAARAFRLDTEINLTMEARTEADRQHIRSFARRVLDHWHRQFVALRPVAPGQLLLERRGRRRGLLPPNPWETWLPWHRLFDPKLSWLYPLKRKLFRMARGRPYFAALVVSLMSIAAVFSSLALAGFPHWAHLLSTAQLRWTLIYSAALSLVWLLPIPFVLVAAIASAHLGFEIGVRIAVASLWVASIWGYANARAFPTLAARYYRHTGPRRLARRIGLRHFPTLVSVIFDPRVSIRSKIAYQGLYCVPLPWFVLLCLLVLPSLVYLGLKAWVAILPANELLKQIYGRG